MQVQAALGKGAEPGIGPRSIWHYVTRKVPGVKYDESRMHLLWDVCWPKDGNLVEEDSNGGFHTCIGAGFVQDHNVVK